MRLSWLFVSGIFQFSELLVQAHEPITEFCTTLGNQDTILQVAALIQEAACDLSSSLADTIVFFQCNNWFPLYEQGVYTTLCYSGTTAITWIASTQIVIVIFAAIMLTFRVAFINLQSDEERVTAQSPVDSSSDDDIDSKIEENTT